MSRITPEDFVGTRCRFQRLRDAKIFNGWINNYFGNAVEVATLTDAPVEVGDEFRIEGYGNHISIVFNAVLKDVGSLDLKTSTFLKNTDGSSGHIEAKQVAFILEVSSVVRFSSSIEPIRLRVQNLESELIIGERVQKGFAVDISNSGAAIIIAKEVQKETACKLILETRQGKIAVLGTVRYCRKDASRPNQYRVGIMFLDFGRIERQRWERLLKEGA